MSNSRAATRRTQAARDADRLWHAQPERDELSHVEQDGSGTERPTAG
jgi:hypothetical protein